MENFLKSETNEIFSILNRIKNRDFSGNSGAAIKNSIYQFSSTFVAKIGALLFTIVLARLLMPELFGLYSLVLGTILVFVYFTDVGTGQTLIRFLSRSLSESKNSEARAYTIYLAKVKLLITSGVLVAFLLLAKPISIYYQKPIFLILLAGTLYFFSISLAGFFQSFFQSLNDFETPFKREAIFQSIRLIFIPLLVMCLISKAVSGEMILSLIFICFGIIWAIIAVFLLVILKKTTIFAAKESKLSAEKKKEVNSFFKSVFSFSAFFVIFIYSDVIILGGFVSPEYVGYYQVAIGLIGALSTLVAFSGSLFPVFSRLKGGGLDAGFKKSLRLTFLLSCSILLISFLFSTMIINTLYGKLYSPAIPFFQGLCFLLILWPFTALYNGYFLAKGKPEVIRNLLIFVSLFNLVLNFLLVSILSNYGDSFAVLGLIFGTVFSNLVYLAGCIWKKKKEK